MHPTVLFARVMSRAAHRVSGALVATVCAALAVSAEPVFAQATWTSATSSTWGDTTKWSTGIVPGVSNTTAALLTNTSASYTVTYDSAMTGTLSGFIIKNTSGNTTTLNINAPGFAIAATGTVPGAYAEMAYATINVNSGGTFTNNGTLGATGTNNAIVINGGLLTSTGNLGWAVGITDSVKIGLTLSSGTVNASNNFFFPTVTMTGGVMNISGGATPGFNGGTISGGTISNTSTASSGYIHNRSGLLTITGSADITTVGLVHTGNSQNFAISGGTVLITGSAFYVGWSNIASTRTGDITQSGGSVTSTNAGGLVVGGSSGALLAGSDYSYRLSSGTLSVEKITLAAAAYIGSGTNRFTMSGGTLNLGSGGFVIGSGSGVKAIQLSGGVIGAKADWSSSADMSLLTGTGSGTATFRGADSSNVARTITLSGILSGSGALAKTGAGILALQNANTYLGATTVTAGRLQIDAAGSINTTSGITVNGSDAELKYNSATPLSKPLTLTQGTLSGTGTIGTAVTVGAGAILSPGNSPGSQSFTSGLTLDKGGKYVWEINDWAGSPGTGYDQLVVSGSALNITAANDSKYTIQITGLTGGNTVGAVTGFNNAVAKTFTIATSGSLTNFAANKFAIDSATSFSGSNSLNNGGFTIGSSGNDIVLNYVPSAVYNLSAAASATAIRVGGTSTITATIMSSTSAVTGPDSLAYAGLGLSGGLGSLSSTNGTLAGGVAGSGSVAFTTLTSGSYAFNPLVTSATNVNIGTNSNAGSTSGVSVLVYNPASANAISPVSLGNIRAGSAFGTGTLSIQNTAANDGYSEKLDASVLSLSGSATSSGSVSLLSANSTSNAITLGLGNGTYSTGGLYSGTAAIQTVTNGQGTSGLGTLITGTQFVAVTGTVWNTAVGSITSGTTVDLRVIHAGASSFGTATLTIQNAATNNGFSEGLNAAVSGSSGGATSGGSSIMNLAAGSSLSTITVGLGGVDTSAAGLKSGTITIGYQSNGSATSGLDTISAGSQTVSLTGGVFSGNGIWNVSGGGSWGTGANSNWRSTENVSAAPGTFADYSSTDTATFNANVSGSTAVIALGSANPSLAALSFTSGSGSYQLSGGTLTLNGGTGTGLVTVSAGSHGIDSAVSMATSSEFRVENDSSLTLSGILSGASSGLTKTGLGLLMLSGSNTYGGNTQISQGTLKIGSSSAFGIGGGVTLSNGATLDLNGFTVANAITNNGGTILGGSLSGTVTASSNTTINSGLGAGAVVTVANGVTTTFGDDATVDAGASIANNGGTVLISRTTNAVMQFAGTITGSGGLTVDGGHVKLSGANTYTGLTQVSGSGTLLSVNSQVQGNVQVGANAELGGSGLIVGNIGGDGLIGPGNSPGILTVQGQVDPTSSTSFAFEFMKTGDPIWSTGTATQNDVLRLTNLTPFVTSLTGSNVVNIYFEVSSLTNGDVFRGGFFSDYSTASLDFAKAIGSPTYAYFVLGSGSGTHSYNGTNYYTLSEYLSANTGSGITGVTASVVTSGTADFSSGTVTNGQVTQFVIIPEPDTIIFAGIGIAMAGWSLWKRRRIAPLFR